MEAEPKLANHDRSQWKRSAVWCWEGQNAVQNLAEQTHVVSFSPGGRKAKSKFISTFALFTFLPHKTVCRCLPDFTVDCRLMEGHVWPCIAPSLRDLAMCTQNNQTTCPMTVEWVDRMSNCQLAPCFSRFSIFWLLCINIMRISPSSIECLPPSFPVVWSFPGRNFLLLSFHSLLGSMREGITQKKSS